MPTTPDGPADVVRRWALCRCVYARPPAPPCRCTEADLSRAAAEPPAATRRWERRLAPPDRPRPAP